MTATVIKLRYTDIERLMDEIAQAGFDEIVLVGFKGDTYEMISTCIGSKSKVIGALEIIKHELLTGN